MALTQMLHRLAAMQLERDSPGLNEEADCCHGDSAVLVGHHYISVGVRVKRHALFLYTTPVIPGYICEWPVPERAERRLPLPLG